MSVHPHTATADVAGYRFVKHGAADGTAVQASASTDAILGVSSSMGAKNGQVLDVVETGVVDIQYGGNVTRGDPLTADAEGKAIKANPGAGVIAQVGGYARVSGKPVAYCVRCLAGPSSGIVRGRNHAPANDPS